MNTVSIPVPYPNKSKYYCTGTRHCTYQHTKVIIEEYEFKGDYGRYSRTSTTATAAFWAIIALRNLGVTKLLTCKHLSRWRAISFEENNTGRLDGLTHFGHLIPLTFTLKYTDGKNNIYILDPHIGGQTLVCW
jgi:hypothetical protein